MEEGPEFQELQVVVPQVLSPCSSGRRRISTDSNSPEFEFWMVRNPSFPQPDLLSADELFSDGVLLPLHLLHHHSSVDHPPAAQPSSSVIQDPAAAEEREAAADEEEDSGLQESGSAGSRRVVDDDRQLKDFSATALLTSSKRWKDIFKKSKEKDKDKEDKAEKKKEKKTSSGGGGGGTHAAELNINIWPFSRSRSAGNGGTRPRMAAAAPRKVSSAPCSRSNSAGESKSRKWPSSPSRGGVHLGRSSPVWQVRRGSGGGNGSAGVKTAEKVVKKEGTNEGRRKLASAVSGRSGGGGSTKARVLNLNVPMCIGYRHQLSCRSDENSAISIAAAAATGSGNGGRSGGDGVTGEGLRGSNLFSIRNIFTKKVY